MIKPLKEFENKKIFIHEEVHGSKIVGWVWHVNEELARANVFWTGQPTNWSWKSSEEVSLVVLQDWIDCGYARLI
jgi:hypothetical protein